MSKSRTLPATFLASISRLRPYWPDRDRTWPPQGHRWMQFLHRGFFLLALSANLLSAPDINGEWQATIPTMIGELKWSFQFQVQGSKVEGTATYEGQSVPLEKGTVESSTVRFEESRDLEGLGPTRIVYRGSIASATEIRFHRAVGAVAEEDFVAKRKP